MQAVATPQAPMFIADDLALDFINSAYGVGEGQRDYFESDQAVADWLQRAGVLASDAPAVPMKGLRAAALRFRDSARALVEQRQAGGWADPGELNRVLASGREYQQLGWARGHTPTLEVVSSQETAAALLVPVAKALAALLVQPDVSRVRACAGDDCTLLFHDHSRGGRRRWCDMAMCGNRAKVGSHRSREKGRSA